MRLIQFMVSVIGRVGLVEENSVFDLTSVNPDWDCTYNIFVEARRFGKTLEEHINGSDYHQNAARLDYGELAARHPGEKMWILPPLDYPDPAHCMVTGTGLTHIGSASQRHEMHQKDSMFSTAGTTDKSEQNTDSQKMFEMGLEGGKPDLVKGGSNPSGFIKALDAEVKEIGSPYPDFSEGCFLVPDAPGWGVELNLEFFEKHPPVKMEDGIIKDFGLNMFLDENWQKRAGRSK